MSNSRNTVAYFKEEGTPGTAVAPTSATDGFLSIEKPDVTTGQREVLKSELLSGNIGVKKPQLGFESASASVVTEMRSHGDASSPTEPDFGVLFKSGIGTPNISVAEAVEAAPAPSATEFGISTEGNLVVGDMFIVDNTTNGRVARFVASMKVDIVAAVNDKIDFTDDDGAVTATLTAATYTHGGSDIVGSIGEHIKTQMETVNGTETVTVAAVQGTNGSWTYTISSTGTVFELNIDGGASTATNFLLLNLGFGSSDLTAAVTYTAASAVYGNRVVCNIAMTTAPTSADVVSASVNYKPLNIDHKHFTSGFYQGNSAVDGYFEQVLGCLVNSIGLTIDTGAIAKMSFDIQGLSSARTATTAASYSPSLEAVQGLVGFNVQCYLNSSLLSAQQFSLTIGGSVTEQKDFNEASGKSGSFVREREITGSINPYADGSTTLFDALEALTDKSMMIVVGKKDAGGFIVGKTVGIYLPQVNFTQVKTSDIDDNIIEDCQFTANTGADGTTREIVMSFA